MLNRLRSWAGSIARWAGGILHAAWKLWTSIGPRWFRVLCVLVLVAVVAWHEAKVFLTPNLTQETIYSVRYLNDGWTPEERQSFYYTPQGTELLGIDYQWFLNLELPLSDEPLATAENLRGWGFIVAPGQRPDQLNPGNLPVGLGRHVDPKTGKERLDIGCATCHTGELHYKGTALRVDGGQAVQSMANAKRGEFITTLAASVFETLYNPFKWDRFATRVAGADEARRDELKKRFAGFADTIKHFVGGAGSPKNYPVEEGRGRVDAVGRIANVVFGYDIDEPGNYHPADAPASYPFIWDIWRFNWVQYTGFTNQAMARNVGESLGVLAPIKLVDAEGKALKGKDFGETVIDVDGLHCAEGLLRMLKPPQWPEDVLGEIDIARATAGKQLFAQHCQGCHGPHVKPPPEWPVADQQNPQIEGQISSNWQWDMAGEISEVDGKPVRRDWRADIWSIPWIPTEHIGTDPKLADNFMDNRYDASKLVPGSSPVNAGDGLQLLLNTLVPMLYERWDITGDAIPNYDGLNVPFRIANKRAYKSRPLHGVWATPPFLHNGSVPTIYDLLSTQEERPRSFYVGNREYDPQRLGYVTGKSPGSFFHDASILGNHNTGHLFTDVDAPGRIGPRLDEAQRYALLEYLKVMGNPAFTEALGGDAQDWAAYSQPPADEWNAKACNSSHLRHGITDMLPKGEEMSL
ncbi:cytochrome c [Mangrovimicrobium sediminis]|uniref:Cytochrome c n=1 Tax=Mangrovimicrobium sediminis TaxID=2562682 RepID=A0A4Z0LVQ4_9GAMM|nr:di-heme-cytochrome C peroxidase [Haliea sp. SAOS-164]TGD71340.1 cytochrome c [Haliea sp. SAOS-164]